MHVSRCCYCIPLRTGILTWGYVKLILLILFIGAILLEDFNKERDVPPVEYAIIFVLVLLGTVDVIFTIIFIVACHKNHRKLLLIYNGYTIAYLFLGGLVLIGWTMQQSFNLSPDKPIPMHTDIIINVAMAIVHIVWSTYMVIVIGSEIKELDTRRGNAHVQFVNYSSSDIADV